MIYPIFLPLIAVVANSIFLTITKKFFRRYGRLTSKEFNWLQFVGITLVSLLVLPFFGVWPAWQEVASVWWLIGGLTVLAVIGNLLYYWGIEHEKISDVEPFLLFNPLGAILIAGIFYAGERSLPIYAVVIFSSLVLLWARYKKHKFALTKGLWAIVLFMLTYGLEAVVIKELLLVFDPVILYFVRSALVLLVLTFFVTPKFSIMKPHHLAPFGIIGGLAVAAMVATYASFSLVGLSETIIVFVLSPILIYILSIFFLKEKWTAKNVIASILVTLAVVLVNYLERWN